MMEAMTDDGNIPFDRGEIMGLFPISDVARPITTLSLSRIVMTSWGTRATLFCYHPSPSIAHSVPDSL